MAYDGQQVVARTLATSRRRPAQRLDVLISMSFIVR